ncbi:OsmC family protein [Brevundimonas sp. NPDC092305]|uniref:OsmC family protein n=1 Tax=Brevundimonas sp. NPDC092305 TaxID=3363957 RepID=UPI00382958C1
MSEYVATVDWVRGDQSFSDRRYCRAHDWRFDGGAVVRGSSAPSSVPLPMSDAAAVDPEEALVASVSSCHMLFFLDFAARAGLIVDRYTDEAVAVMDKDDRGRTAIVLVRLRPLVVFTGTDPDKATLDDLHHRAHEACYIANSIRAEVRVEAR